MHGWLTDRRFLTRDGRPKSLTVGGAKSSFVRLVKAHGGDISPRAVLEELMRSRRVRRTGEQLRLETAKLPVPRSGFGALTRIIPTLVDGLRIASREPPSTLDSLLYRLRLHASSAVELSLIRERCSSSVQSLLNGLSESLERQLTVPYRKRTLGHSLTVTVLLGQTGAEKP